MTTKAKGQASSGEGGRASAPLAGPPVVSLDDPRAASAPLVGAKAAALARATAAGLPVLPGFVVTTAATDGWGTEPAGGEPEELRPAWRDLSGDGTFSLVVRSSSTIEDGESTSMAGMFTSVLDVRGWDDFLGAIDTVLSSMKAVPGIEMAPMAVLVQPLLEARLGGVLFGADPVSGRTDRLVVAAAEGAPEQLVSGTVDGAQYLLSRRGRLLRAERPVAGLSRAERLALARLARQVAGVFGGPQDVEWAFEGRTLRLLQSRPITAVAPPVQGVGPLLGPGPVAETFPQPLSALEEDLWVEPLRAALAEAVLLTGAASRRQVDQSPVVTTVGGRVAADLGFLGVAPPRGGFLRRFDPRPPARRLVASWRVGRLGAALPGLVSDVLHEVDEQLLAVPPLEELSDERLVGLLGRSRQALVALNGYEVLSGLLVDAGAATATTTTGASVALQVLAQGRAAGRSDTDIATSHPVVLALVAPHIGRPGALPPTAGLPPVAGAGAPAEAASDGEDAALLREALRLRVRWVQELTARAAWELGVRLAATGTLAGPEEIAHLRLVDLDEALAGRLPADLDDRRDRSSVAPLPAAFRLSASGEVVAELLPGAGGGGRGAGGGRGTGTVHQGDSAPEAGAVLVVRTLDPGLAATLPHLGGLVAETGSVLSHLAILAREFGIPTAVGVPDALRRFPPGATVVVDGSTGEVSVVQPAAAPVPAPAEEAGYTVTAADRDTTAVLALETNGLDVVDLRDAAASRTTEGALA